MVRHEHVGGVGHGGAWAEMWEDFIFGCGGKNGQIVTELKDLCQSGLCKSQARHSKD